MAALLRAISSVCTVILPRLMHIEVKLRDRASEEYLLRSLNKACNDHDGENEYYKHE